MEGYIKNNSPTWRHALKRSVGPGEKISLDDLYEQYGIKHDIKEGDQFVNWLRQVKLRNSDIWEIRYKVAGAKDDAKKEDQPELDSKAKKSVMKSTQSTPFVKVKDNPEELAQLSVRQAREIIPQFTDQKTLRYALNMASQLSNRDTLCRMLRKRIQELELSRR
jgi:hypothetical protein